MSALPHGFGDDLGKRKRMESKEVRITPEMARSMLQANEGNRKIKNSVVERYARDMKAGEWLMDPNSPISVDEFGNLINGQHRLKAVILANVPVDFIVWFNVPAKSKEVCDQQTPRTIFDALTMAGVSLQRKHVEVGRFLFEVHTNAHKPTTTEAKRFLAKYWEPIDFIVANMTEHTRGVGQACVMAALASCYYAVGSEKLGTFIAILREGKYSAPHEETAINLRNHLLMHGASNGSYLRRCVYMRTQRAVQSFAKGEVLQRMITPAEPIYELPDDVPAA